MLRVEHAGQGVRGFHEALTAGRLLPPGKSGVGNERSSSRCSSVDCRHGGPNVRLPAEGEEYICSLTLELVRDCNQFHKRLAGWMVQCDDKTDRPLTVGVINTMHHQPEG